MALPYIRLPSGFPDFMAAGHTVAPVDVYTQVPVSTGTAIRRRVYTTAPLDVAVTARLTAAQAAAFGDWFEAVLLAGLLEFSAQIGGMQLFKAGGAAPAWWRMRFVGGRPVVTEPRPGIYWQLAAKVRLVGDASATAPATPPLAADIVAPLQASASIDYGLPLAADITMALTGAVA